MRKKSTVRSRIQKEIRYQSYANIREQEEVTLKRIAREQRARYQLMSDKSDAEIEILIANYMARGMVPTKPTSMPKPPLFPVRSSNRRKGRRGS